MYVINIKNIDSRIKITNKNNSGVSIARNIGIKNSNGEYIQFVDADDELDLNMCEVLINSLIENRADITICGYKILYNKKVTCINCINKTINNLKDIEDYFSFLYQNWILNSPWNKIYKRNMINELFDENLSLGEDLIFNLNYLKNVKNNFFK